MAAAAGLAQLQRALFGRRSSLPQLARYLLLQRLSAGGGGVVYRAYDPQLDRPVAVKIIETSPGNPRANERRLVEAYALAALSHRNVVQIFDVGTYHVDDDLADPMLKALMPAGGIFLVLELVEGQTLAQWVSEGTHDWTEVRDAYVQAGRGLMAVHAAGLVHHDFKPINAVRARDGRVCVVDFGLARETEASSAEIGRSEEGVAITRAGPETRAAGTPYYMAPEQHLGGETSPATDQFAFCVALWEALYGTRPFEGADVAALGHSKFHDPPSVPAGHRVPGWVARALLRGVSPDPAARWPSMDALLRALLRDRSRARPGRWLLGLGVGLGLAAGAVQMARGPREAPDACDDPRAALVGVWDDAREADVRAAFAAVPRTYAVTAWSTVDHALDGYRERWLEQLEAVCSAAAPELDPLELRPLARACLLQRRSELAAVVDVLAEADAGVIDHALTTIASLRAPRACIDPAQLRMEEVLPEEPQRRAAVQEAYASLARVGVLTMAGRHDEAVALAESVQDRVEALEHPPLRAEVLRYVAQARTAAGDELGGREVLREAIAAAILTNNHRSAAWAWNHLVFDEVEQGAGYRAVLELVPVAEQAVVRTHDDALRVIWLETLGSVHLSGGDVPRGLAVLQQAQALGEADPERSLHLRQNVALGYALGGDWETAEARLRQLLPEIEQHFGAEHPEVGIVRLNLAAAAFTLGRHEEAIALAEDSNRIFRERYGHHPQIAAGLGTIAEAWYQLGNVPRARAAAEAALAEVARVEGASDASERGPLHLLADLEEGEQRLSEAREYRHRTLELEIRKYGADSFYTWISRLDLAELDALLGHEEPARAVLADALKWTRARPPDMDAAHWCWTLGLLGQLQLALGETDPAIDVSERALACAVEHELAPTRRGSIRWMLAQAVEERDPARAVALMREASSEASPVARAKIDAWLREHGSR